MSSGTGWARMGWGCLFFFITNESERKPRFSLDREMRNNLPFICSVNRSLLCVALKSYGCSGRVRAAGDTVQLEARGFWMLLLETMSDGAREREKESTAFWLLRSLLPTAQFPRVPRRSNSSVTLLCFEPLPPVPATYTPMHLCALCWPIMLLATSLCAQLGTRYDKLVYMGACNSSVVSRRAEGCYMCY